MRGALAGETNARHDVDLERELTFANIISYSSGGQRADL